MLRDRTPPRVGSRSGPWGPVLLAAALLAAGCKKEETVWVAFNAPNQTLSVEVLPVGSPLGEDVELVLESNLGRTEVGLAAVSPGSGPVGTEHLLTVDVFDEWEDIVGKVTVTVDSEAVKDLDDDGDPDSRGEAEYDLLHDSADHGAWALTLMSRGADQERRTDRFVIVLWEPETLGAATGDP